uniref:Uncharacterized protein n=2 Tax=Cannabis sativa TaxID=3483 RepID=A0A803R2T7_CANSA
MNLFGVLKYKKMGEDFLLNSGLPCTIIRAGRLTDGPYTSYDLNTLLKATAGQRRAVLIGQGDKLVGEVSRLIVAEACIQALTLNPLKGKFMKSTRLREKVQEMISRNGENYLKQQPNSQAHYVNCKNKLATPHGKFHVTSIIVYKLYRTITYVTFVR